MPSNKKIIKSFHELFGLQWVGKKYAQALSVSAPLGRLEEDEFFNRTYASNKANNLLIKGDNLEVLKLLLPQYSNRVKMIYIDPPYNTGTEAFLYSDRKYFDLQNLTSSQEFDSEQAQKILKKLDHKENTHSAWLSFMFPRLFLARELLQKDGVIFISIDDRELAYLRILMDEIFGEENFVGLFKWNKTSTPPSLSNKIRQKYEYILCYEKEKSPQVFFGGIEKGGDMPLLNEGNTIKELHFPPNSIHFKITGDFPSGIYNNIELMTPLKIAKPGRYPKSVIMKGAFKWNQDYLNRQIEKGTELIIKSEKFSIRYKKKGERIKKPDDIISKTQCGVGTNADAKKELTELFGLKNLFDYPKPVSLLKYLINFTVSNDQEDLVLDFFAGSGTTGEAVMQLNHQDGGNRRFILVQSEEKIPVKSTAYHFIKEDLGQKYPSIFDITLERLIRAHKRLHSNDKYHFRKWEVNLKE